MKKSPILGVAMLCVIGAAAQPNSTVPKNIRAANTLDNLFDINGLSKFDNLYGIPLEPGGVVGNTYLDRDWNRSTFLLYDVEKMLEGFPSRYEIKLDQFEIRSGSGVKVLNGSKVKSFVWIDSLTRLPQYFVNGRDLRDQQNVPLSGFFEVMTEGAVSLLAKTDVVVKDPSYNEKFDMGNRNTRILKKTSYYYAEKGVARALPSRKKKLLPIFGKHASAVEEFIRVNGLSLDEGDDLKAIFGHYSGLVATN